MNKKEKGYSLIELLVIIVIVSLVIGIVGYTAIRAINNTNNTTDSLTENSIKESAKYYIEEYYDKIVWKKSPNNDNESYSCISSHTLINKGYLKEKQLNKNKDFKFIIITKDNNENILSQEIDKEGICQTSNIITIPTSQENCYTNLIYSNVEQLLTKNDSQYYKFSINNQEPLGKEAGTYKVTANLISEDYIWEDGSTENKIITCKIKKATPNIEINPSDSDITTTLSTVPVTFKSNIDGNIELKSSNEDYAIATLEQNKLIKENDYYTSQINIKTLSSRNTITFITITLIPKDKNNYKNTSLKFQLGKIVKQKIKKPTDEYCKKLTYNRTSQLLVNDVSSDAGFYFNNKYGIDATTYNVTAHLKYGYVWNDNSTEPVTINCKINKATPTLILTPTSSEIYKTESIKVTATTDTNGEITATTNNSSNVGINSIEPTTIKSISNSIITVYGKEVSDNNKITVTLTPNDTSNYLTKSTDFQLNVKNNIFTLTYDSNGGTSCSPSTKKITYNQPYGTLCKPTRTNYVFDGWFTEKTGGNKITSTTIASAEDITVYAHWQKLACTINYSGTIGKNGWYKTHGTVTMSHDISSEKISKSGIKTSDGTSLSNSITTTKDTSGKKFEGYIYLKGEYGGTTVTCSKTLKIDTEKPYICKYSSDTNYTPQRFCLKTTKIDSSDPNKNEGGSVARWGFAIKDNLELGSITVTQYKGNSVQDTATANRNGKISNEGIWWLSGSNKYKIIITDEAGNKTTYMEEKLKVTSGTSFSRCGEGIEDYASVCTKDTGSE